MFFKKYKKTIGSLCFVGVLVFLLGVFKNTASYLVYPFLVAQNKCVTTIKKYTQKRQSIAELTAVIEQLKKERERLIGDLVRLHASIDYLDELEELIDFKQRYDDGKGVLAQVLLRNFSQQSHFFIVDAGSRAGVAVNMPVVYHNCLIGRVQEVYPLYSKILLITDSACKVSAYCSQTDAQGIYRGNNSLGYGILDHVSNLSDIQQKDFVFSGGQGIIFPRGFALGRIASYERNDLLYTITVEPLLALETISYVLILPLKIECNNS